MGAFVDVWVCGYVGVDVFAGVGGIVGVGLFGVGMGARPKMTAPPVAAAPAALDARCAFEELCSLGVDVDPALYFTPTTPSVGALLGWSGQATAAAPSRPTVRLPVSIGPGEGGSWSRDVDGRG